MRSWRISSHTIIAAVLLSGLSQLTVAHGDGGHNDERPTVTVHGAGQADHSVNAPTQTHLDQPYRPPTYWALSDHASLMYAHIALMLLAWVLLLPIAVMLSVARSRLRVLAQATFLLTNAGGVLLSILYNGQTPDRYENNAHHKIGWAISWIAVVWAVLGIIDSYTRPASPDFSGYQPITAAAIAQHEGLHQRSVSTETEPYRYSQDSGRGTDRNTASLFGKTRTSSWRSEASSQRKPYQDDECGDHELEYGDEKMHFFRVQKVDDLLDRTLSRFQSCRHVSRGITLMHTLLERLILVLGFVGFLTGFAAYGGIGRENQVFNIAAHFVKGGIFFWYGLLTFGRWLGCFADFGWAWNIKPGRELVGKRSLVPSAEFVESFVIFLYGASNVFLEHLAAWGDRWTAMDLEHLSITIMFFGGGLLGMLIESTKLRRLLNNTMNPASTNFGSGSGWSAPDSYGHSINPMPALVIMLLGLMMSSHHQHSMVSSMIHKQWGTLFTGFAMARVVTYIIMWLKPPQSFLASRPPSEIIAAFCLVSGGIIFMASNSDSVLALESYGLDAMFVFTVVMGSTGLIMAWEVICVAVKAWASQRRRATSGPLRHHVAMPSASGSESPA